MLKIIGAVAVAGIVGAGVKWLVDNLTFKQQPERYTYRKDMKGNEVVKDNTDA
jgi:hypothetical protein